MIEEIVLIKNALIYSGPRTKIWDGDDKEGDSDYYDCPFNYAFFDNMSGEVWGYRVVQGEKVSPWIYCPGEYPNLLLPYEERQLNFPFALFAFLLNCLAEQINEHPCNQDPTSTVSDPSTQDNVDG